MYLELLPAMAGRPDWRPQLGYARPAMARACVRSSEFFADIGAELGEWWLRLAEDSAAASPSSWRAVAAQDREEAAEALADVVRTSLPSVRAVVMRRASGQSWRRICAAMPSRAYFSMREDWMRFLSSVAQRHSDLVERVL